MKISVINLRMELIRTTFVEGLIDKTRYIQCHLFLRLQVLGEHVDTES